MRLAKTILACVFAITLTACGDKDAEDTGEDTASVDTGTELE